MPATVTGKVVTPSGVGIASAVLTFRAEPFPQFVTVAGQPRILLNDPISVTADGVGDFSLTLSRGKYEVKINGSNRFKIDVNADSGTLQLNNLVY